MKCAPAEHVNDRPKLLTSEVAAPANQFFADQDKTQTLTAYMCCKLMQQDVYVDQQNAQKYILQAYSTNAPECKQLVPC